MEPIKVGPITVGTLKVDVYSCPQMLDWRGVTVSDKQSSLLRYIIRYGNKNFKALVIKCTDVFTHNRSYCLEKRASLLHKEMDYNLYNKI
jgi:hypothetical protein